MRNIFRIGWLFAILPLYIHAQQINTLSPKEKAEGWQLLFDGKTLNGWHTFNHDKVLDGCWSVYNGEITFKLNPQHIGRGDLVTDDEFENFDFRLEWKVDKGSNSGIFFGVKEGIEYGWASSTGVEMQILDNIDGADRHDPTHLAGAMYDLIDCQTTSTPKPAGEWNQVRIVKDNGQVTFWLNQIITAKVDMNSETWKDLVRNSKFNGANTYNGADFGKFSKGKISLQDHFDTVFFRNIKIKKIP